ncbi:hypothetical protein F383_00179 [Gossypium arboreum]|uniref:Uncharacterized protein n=1 Tax=Gossypium arboreum TaxID=29729 RepID=A0A0B0MQC3_GOSAR|nr:hypothetical protein F383_00179 [Gossypium arboreum]
MEHTKTLVARRRKKGHENKYMDTMMTPKACTMIV